MIIGLSPTRSACPVGRDQYTPLLCKVWTVWTVWLIIHVLEWAFWLHLSEDQVFISKISQFV